MKETVNNELYKEVALELGISEKLVQDVINNGESKCTAHMMASNTFDGVRWPYMGVFKAKHKSVQILNYMKGLNSVQKEFFLSSLRSGRFKKLNQYGTIGEVLLQDSNRNKSG